MILDATIGSAAMLMKSARSDFDEISNNRVEHSLRKRNLLEENEHLNWEMIRLCLRGKKAGQEAQRNPDADCVRSTADSTVAARARIED